MPLGSSFDIKSTVLVLALVLVPIVVLFCILAVALACSEFWSSRPGPAGGRRWFFWKRFPGKHKRSRSDPPCPCASAKGTDCTENDIAYRSPVEGKEHV